MTLMDKIAVWSLVAAAVAAAASVVMLVRNWNAATTKDVKRVEDNTADTVRRLAAVHDHLAAMNLRMDEQNMRASAQRVPISVAGNAVRGQPLNVTLTLVLEDVRLTQIELLNQMDMKKGRADCIRKDPRNYIATIHPIDYEPWYLSGERDISDPYKHVLKLRAHLIMVDQKVHRDFAVNLRIGASLSTDRSMSHQHLVTIEGAS
jgi:hypothetical protein